MPDYHDVCSTVHLLRQYGFMTDAENHQCEREVKFIHEGYCFFIVLLYIFQRMAFFSLQSVYVGVLVCECMASCAKVDIWSSASQCLITNKTSR